MNKPLKIVGINTSARGKMANSYFLLKKAFDSIKDKDIKKQIIVASELNLKPCQHHYSMNANMCDHPCVITQNDKTDQMHIIYDAILSADIVIFSTPIYWNNHSQLMQLIVERLTSLENANSTHKKVVVKNKLGAIMVVGHEDGYQHVIGNLMSFLTEMGLIFGPQAYAAWVGESDELTHKDKKRIETDKDIHETFIDLVKNQVNFAKNILYCGKCGNKFDYAHVSNRKVK